VYRERQGRQSVGNIGFLLHGWYLDTLYDWCAVRPYFFLVRALHRVVENSLLQRLGVGSISGSAQLGSRLLNASENGYLATYAGILILGAALVLAYLF
jgi:NADH:ubiquinone oxidoreductase subunit 5 (subunit L)/multisubunit Na+/H+ antiporter MnhA subunit